MDRYKRRYSKRRRKTRVWGIETYGKARSQRDLVTDTCGELKVGGTCN